MTNRGPSYFALDQRPDRAAHGELPAYARGHLEALTRAQAVPAWARALAEAPPRRRWLPLLAAGLALATLLVLVLRPRQAVDVKGGGPGVRLFIKRDGRVAQWMPGQSLRPGDGLRLEASGGGFGFVTVLAGEGAPTALFAGPLLAPSMVLPPAWEVDAAGDAERVFVVFSKQPAAVDRARQAALASERDGDFWVAQLRLAKERP
jgi:hypothetical protein